jgi:hypothetical protein
MALQTPTDATTIEANATRLFYEMSAPALPSCWSVAAARWTG